jgi:hypothetical protein
MKPDDIIEQRDTVVTESVEQLTATIPEIQKEIYRKFLKVLKQLDTDSEGKVKTTTANIKTITSFIYKDVAGVLKGSDYKQAVMTFVKAFDKSAQLTDKYFDAIKE